MPIFHFSGYCFDYAWLCALSAMRATINNIKTVVLAESQVCDVMWFKKFDIYNNVCIITNVLAVRKAGHLHI